MSALIAKRRHEDKSKCCYGSFEKIKTHSMRNDVLIKDHEINDTVSSLKEGERSILSLPFNHQIIY